jgi:iron complex transport system ATP-binding protein
MTGVITENVVVTRGSRTILNGISLQIDAGDFLSIVGPNGSGKSSLLRAIAGVWPLTDGAIRIGGRRLQEFHRRELAQIVAFVPQDVRMDFAFTVAEIVAMGRHPFRGRFERMSPADHESIEDALAACDIGHLRTRFVTTLSGGERQRVAIARCLAVRPQIVLLDEPTASLDVQHSLDVLELCSKLSSQGTSVILATHDLNAVARFTRRVALIDSGRIAHAGDRDSVFNSKVIETVFGVAAELLIGQAGDPVYIFRKKKEM